MAQSMMLIEKCSHRVSWYNVDTGELQGRVSLPDYPHEFVVDDDFHFAYVGHYGVINSGAEGTDGRSVIVIDIRKQEIVHTYDLGEHRRPHGMGLDGQGRLYVLSEWTNNLLVKENPRAFDQGWDHIAPTGGDKSHLFALTKDGNTAYSMNLVSGDVTVLNPYDTSVKPISIVTGEKPEGRCLAPDEKVLYTTNRISNTVTVIDTATNEVIRSFPTPDDPCRVYHDPKRNRLVTLNHFGGCFTVYDEATGKEIHNQPTPANPLALCLDDEQDFAYVAIDCEQVQKYSLETFELVQTIDVGKEPDVMVILPEGFAEKYWTPNNDKPTIAVLVGDPSGIGPELVGKLLNDMGVRDAADIVLVGDQHMFEQAAQQSGLDVPLNPINEDEIGRVSGLTHLNMETIEKDEVEIAEVTLAGGISSLRCFDKALDLAQAGKVDGIMFAPVNKAAMTKAGLNAEDEHIYMARYIGYQGYHSELNVLKELMTTRVTSHIGIKDVAKNITQEGIIDAVQLAHDTIKKSGVERPSIAVASLNPHGGDNGKFGREEIDIIAPAIEKCADRDMDVTGPWPSDTVFLKAKHGEFDAVVTMYHDQGQIAIKLLGFERGVTVVGGLPIPVATPAHGTAFDIAGQNKANVGATRHAFDLVLRLAKTHRAERNAA